jgi:hypothetical protein
MRHPFLALSFLVSLIGVASAQDVAPHVPPGEPKATIKSDEPAAQHKSVSRREFFTIEIKVLEGSGQLHQNLAARMWHSAAMPRAQTGYYPRDRMAPPANAPLPNAVYVSASDFRRPKSHPDHKEDLKLLPPKAVPSPIHSTHAADERDDLWDDTRTIPGVTVLAEPKLAVVAGLSGVVQIQNVQVFTYLEPLSDGKFQAKQTDPTELGMKFVLGIQPAEEDAHAVEISPLEIELSVLDGREPVEGLDLDVGKPIVATRSLKTTAKMKLGSTRLIPIPSGRKTQAALLLRINRIDSAEHEQRILPPATSPDPDESSP